MTSPYDQSPHRVRLEHGPVGARELAGATYAVVVDVLSFTTTLSVAMDLGIDVLPFRWEDASAAEHARRHDATLAVGRLEAGDPDAPDAVSLSPASLRRATGIRRLVLPSPNGSATSFLLAGGGATVVGASLRNAGAVASWLAQRLREDPDATVAVVAAGERWPDGSLRPALEDLLGAGAVVAGLQAAGIGDVSPEAAAATAAYDRALPRLRETLLGCSSGRELVARGFADDVDVALEVDASSFVPVLVGEHFTRARGSKARPAG